MDIIYSQRFIDEFKDILEFIAKDSLTNSLNFEAELKSKINALGFMPYRFRQSTKIDDKNVRDMVFRGYVIIYAVEQECIKVLGIYKAKAWKP